ncbi:MAG: TonB-dependent receptor [Prevotellaceae bacterium]|nr:TonB-dependent receptor [Prevotellaceae bacterium]
MAKVVKIFQYAASVLFFAVIATVSGFSQNEATEIRGRVFSQEGGKKQALHNANVYFPGSNNIVLTDSKGNFKITRKEGNGNYLYAGLVGYSLDSIAVEKISGRVEFVLVEGIELTGAVITGNNSGTVISRITPVKTELITKTGLVKMACCNLSESFENSATVTVGFADAISGAKQVQLLGLSGIYSQLLTENVPTHHGLLSTFGWSYIPGSWLESIQISKGASSVVNGYESISGQINLEMKKPNYTDPFFLNLYADQLGRYEANITSTTKVAKDLWSSLLLHGSLDSDKSIGGGSHDYNGDTFSDMPESKFVNLSNRWFYLSEAGIQSRTAIKFLYDEREGGQHEEHFADHGSHGELYTTRINNKGFGLENKTGFTVGEKEGQSIGIINSFSYSEENLRYGKKLYSGLQNSYFGNILFTSDLGTSHRYTVGGSFTYDNYVTRYEDALSFNAIPSTPIDRHELIPGVYGEYTYSYLEKFTVIVGAREDYNSRYGWLFTPRANVRYNVLKELVLRASVGRGFRSPNVIPDNLGLLATSRKYDLSQVNELDIEDAWNYGGNVSVYIPVFDERTLTLSVDYFHTQFNNQAVVDMERDRNSVFFYNQHGASYADAWQADLAISPFKGFDIFTAFRYNSTKITYSENGNDYKVEKPLTSRYRGLINLAYATNLRKWVFDFTAQINGPSRIPGLNGYLSQERNSKPFPIYFAQITKNTRRFDIYLGVENIFDFKQKDPILNPDQPFGRDFDSSLVWGPIVGRKIYGGIRLRLGKLH